MLKAEADAEDDEEAAAEASGRTVSQVLRTHIDSPRKLNYACEFLYVIFL